MTNTYSMPILLRGDMIATLTGQPVNQGNPGDSNFGIVMPGAEAIGTTADVYRLVWTINTSTDSTAEHFSNGQGWTLQSYDPAADPDGDPATGDEGWTDVPGLTNLNPNNDLVNGLGDGDEYVVFNSGSGFLLYNLNGGLPESPTTLTYLATDESGDPAAGDNDGRMDFYDSYAAVACFVAGTLIDTPTGPRAVETLAPGDLVRSRSGAERELVWVSSQQVSGEAIARHPNLRPVRIQAGALGAGKPTHDLWVSPQHRLLVRSKIAERLSGTPEVLVPAIHLTHLPGISQTGGGDGVSYHNIMCDSHEIIVANGAPAESFLPGRQALKAVAPIERERLFALFPDLAVPLPGSQLRPARPILSGRAGRALVARHRKNKRALLPA